MATITLSVFAYAGLILLVAVLLLLCIRYTLRIRHLEIEAATFRTVAEEAGDGLLLQEEDSRILWANRAYCELFGYSLDELVGRYPQMFALPEDCRPDLKAVQAFRYTDEHLGFLEIIENVKKSGEHFTNQLRIARVAETGLDQAPRYVVVSRDVTLDMARSDALAEAHARIKHQATTDELTGLSNRRAMTELLDQCLAAGPLALLAVDLNDFKGMNDNFGHAAGDALLVHAGRIIQTFLRDGWHGARMGGDEFILIIPGSLDWATAARHAIALKRKLAVPMTWQETALVCRASLGVALADGETSVDELMHQADVALYAAKTRRNTRVALYDEKMHEAQLRRVELRSSLAEAVRSETLEFYAQPTVNLRDNSVRGFELLVRWTHPKLGPVSAGTIVDILGEMALLRQLDMLAASAALRTYCRLRDVGRPDLLVGFNVSPGTLKTPDFVDALIWKADALDVPTDRIIVELLETTVFQSTDRKDSTAGQVARLKDEGFRPLLDDFGIGYAGLSHLAQLGIEGLKIDRSLVSQIHADPVSRRIVETVISLCRDLGFRVVAEGVETTEQLQVLKDLGCETCQGFLFSKPVPVEEAIEMVAPGHVSESAPLRLTQT